MLFSLSVVPVGRGDSMIDPVSDVVREIEAARLPFRINGMSTVIEGEWDEVMPVIHKAEKRLRNDNERVFMVLTVDDHEGPVDRLTEAVEDVERKLGHPLPH